MVPHHLHRSLLRLGTRVPALLSLAMAMAGVLAAKPVQVGYEPKAEPFAFVDEGGQPNGFAIELLREIGRAQHVEMQFQVRPWAELIEEFRAGDHDIIVNVARAPDRLAYIDFSVPYSDLRAGVFVRRGTRIDSESDLAGKRFAVMSRGLSHDYVLRRGWASREELIIGTDVIDCLRKLDEGECDVVFGTELVLSKHVRELGLRNIRLTSIELPDLTYQLRFGVHRGEAALLFQLNEGLAAVRANGTFDRLHEKWLGPLEPRRLRLVDLQPYVLPATLTITLILSGLIWQRRLLRKLRRSEQRLKLVLEGGGHTFWDWDIVRDEVSRDASASALLGLEMHELTSTREAWRVRIHPEDLPRVDRAVEDLVARGRELGVDYRMQGRNGEWRWIFTAGRVLERRADGTASRAAGTHTDISERKRSEEERAAFQRNLLESQKLEGLGLLAGGIAHDFNNLLAVILGHVTLLRTHGVDADSANHAQQQIETAARRAADLCRQMLAYAGRGSITLEPLNLNSLVRETVELLRSSLERCSELRLDLQPTIPAVTGDASQLRQVVMNLVLNASEALPAQGGRILVSTTERELDDIALAAAVHGHQAKPGRYLCLVVEDNGTGMTDEVRARIFNPFFTTKATGRGLGLAAVLGIVRSHDGAFYLDTAPGRGSRFSICLPVSADAPVSEELPPAPPPPAPSSAVRVLVVDDDPSVLSMTAAVLRHHGYDVVTADGGVAALRTFSRDPHGFAAVLLDVTMPGMDGVATLLKLRELRADMPALMMSGFSTRDVLSRLPADRPPEFLQKPFSQDELFAKLSHLLASQR